MNRLAIGFAVVGTLFSLACDSDDEGGGGSGTFNTSVGSSKTIDKLSSAESAQFCKDAEAWADSFSKSIGPKFCKVAGLLTDSKAECEKTVSDCVKEVSVPDESTGMCMPPENCTATVGEVEKCLNDTVTTLNSFLDKFPTCAQIADGSGSVPLSEPAQPASCKAIEKTCPDVAGVGSEFGDGSDF